MEKTNRFLSLLFLAGITLSVNNINGQALQPGVIAASQTVCLGYPIAPFTSVSPATGGTGLISYMWEVSSSPGFGFSAAGVTTETLNPFNYGTSTYYLRRAASTSVDGTVYSNEVCVYRPPLPTISISTSTTFACPGQAYSFSVITDGVSYNWTGPNGFTSTAPSFTINNPQQATHQGNYTCIVTGTNGCTKSSVKYLEVLTFFVITPVYKCYGTPATLNAESLPITYSWAGPSGFTGSGNTAYVPSVTDLTTGTYSITGQFNATCIITKYINLYSRQLPEIEVIPSSSLICPGQNVPFVSFTASGAVNYFWSGSQVPLQNPQIVITPSVTTSYTIVGEDAYGCKGLTETTIEISECTGLRESYLPTSTTTIYPNPSNGNFEISGSQTTAFRIINAMGQLIDTVELNKENNFKYNATHFAAGIYYLIPQNPFDNSITKFVVYK